MYSDLLSLQMVMYWNNTYCDSFSKYKPWQPVSISTGHTDSVDKRLFLVCYKKKSTVHLYVSLFNAG